MVSTPSRFNPGPSSLPGSSLKVGMARTTLPERRSVAWIVVTWASVMLAWLRSAGLLPYRLVDGPELLIAHPGGPYFARRDNGWWSIVKGIVEANESDLEAAAREFEEETGWPG